MSFENHYRLILWEITETKNWPDRFIAAIVLGFLGSTSNKGRMAAMLEPNMGTRLALY